MKQGIQSGIKLVNANVDYMQVFVTINRDGMKTNADVNVKKYLFGILVIVSVINYVMLENI